MLDAPIDPLNGPTLDIPGYIPIPGCTCAGAMNYDELATLDDGSCEMPEQANRDTPARLASAVQLLTCGLCFVHSRLIHTSFTLHSQLICTSFTPHSRLVHTLFAPGPHFVLTPADYPRAASYSTSSSATSCKL